jgi:hypothetical protein
LPNAGNEEYLLVSFSPDGKRLLLGGERLDTDPAREYRDTEIAFLNLEGEISEWENAWDILGLKDCDALIEPKGLSADGEIVLEVRPPPLMSIPSTRKCVSDAELYKGEIGEGKAEKLSSNAEIESPGTVTGSVWRTCKTDPDIVGACYWVHGRLSIYNGTPSARIWKVGTNRMLGVHEDVLPGDLGSIDLLNIPTFGDFYVCPFSRERPGAMRFVCIESEKNLRPKKADQGVQ